LQLVNHGVANVIVLSASPPLRASTADCAPVLNTMPKSNNEKKAASLAAGKAPKLTKQQEKAGKSAKQKKAEQQAKKAAKSAA
jgi:hypothetical protein